jgi:hypothetical protein
MTIHYCHNCGLINVLPTEHCENCGHQECKPNVTNIEELRKLFESQARDSHGFRRSTRGTYTNPVVARDWKWFLRGVQASAK